MFFDSRRGFPRATLDFFYPPEHPSMPLLVTLTPGVESALPSDRGLCEFIANCLDEECYVELFVDEHYIPNRAAHRAHHFVHRLLVFGYDSACEAFDIIGFLKSGKYGVSTVSYSELRDAYCSEERIASSARRAVGGEANEIRLFRHESRGRCLLDVQQVKGFLSDYLLARDSSHRCQTVELTQREQEGSGVAVYDCLRRRLDYSIRCPEFCDFLSMHVLWEHKRCMTERIEYLMQCGILSRRPLARAARAIEDQAWTLRMMLLKFGLRRDTEIPERAVGRLLALAEQERDFLEDLASGLASS